MASKKKGIASKLRIPAERRESESYLLSPGLCSPSQFSLSTSYSYIDGFHSPDNSISKQMQGSWQNCTMGSMAPLLPRQHLRSPGTWVQNDWRNCQPGVGDLEHVHIEGMNQNKNYDYADYGHQYEELPGRKSIAKYPEDSGMDSRSEFYQSSGGATDIVSDAEDTANIVNGRGEKRKRVNPLYDAMTQSMPSIYNKTKQPVDEKLRSQVLCLKITVIVLLVLTVSALVASIYTVINHTQSKDDPDPLLTPKVQKLSEDFSRLEELLSSFDDNNDTMKVLSDLIKKVNELDANVSSQTHSLYEQIVSSRQNIDRNSQAISDSHANVSQVISDLNTTLQLQIYNFSKQEGPQGPQGVANFSRCWYYNVTGDSAASDLFPSYSAWAPTEIELERSIPLFATCTVNGGTEEHIEVHAISSQKVQYRCRCAGVTGQSRRNCTVHILICPRQS